MPTDYTLEHSENIFNEMVKKSSKPINDIQHIMSPILKGLSFCGKIGMSVHTAIEPTTVI